MLEGYKILTVTHHTTNLKEIGKYMISDTSENAGLQSKLEALKEQFGIDELMYLSTCNRVMYFFYSTQSLSNSFVQNFFQSVNPGLNTTDILALDQTVHTYHGEEAMQHLFEVAASVNSMVIGEREILRQLREAYKQSNEWKLTGDNIRLAMKTTVESAKEVYNRTRIGEKPVSVVSLAIQQLLKTNLSRTARLLIVGAGQTNLLVTKFLKKHEFSNIVVFNRTLERAQQLANIVKGSAQTLADLPNYKEGFDAMIICTGATEAIVDIDLYEKILNGNSDEKIIIDLSVPNNIAADVVEKFNINYIEIEDLRALAAENMAFRKQEISHVKELLTVRIDQFKKLHQERIIERALSDIPVKIKAIKQKAMNEIFHKELETLDDPTKDLVEKMLTYMEKQCISVPMKAAKEQLT